MVKRMSERPLVLALANPVPEIMPEEARAARPDVIMATGRSDLPNQVNNVLCFPFIFRGALDVGATTINEEMKAACVKALADLAMMEPSERVTGDASGQGLKFGPDYLIPKPFDHRLLIQLAPAVAQAAMDSGVAQNPIDDMEAYTEKLRNIVYRTRSVMRPMFEKARKSPKRLVYAEGEGRRVLQAAQQVADDGIAFPILVGRADVIHQRIQQLGLRLRPGEDCELCNILDDARYRDYWGLYHDRVRRSGKSVREAQTLIRTDSTAVAAVMLERGEADAMLCGSIGKFENHLHHVREVIGLRKGIRDLSTVTAMILPRGPLFLCDTHVTPEPSAEELVEMTRLAAAEVRAFGIKPKVALLSRSNFGSHKTAMALKMQEAVKLLHERKPDLEVEGEMHAELALSEKLRENIFGPSRLSGSANLMVMPNSDAAHIAYSLLKVLGGGVAVGPILIGAAKPVHVVTESVTVRGIVNMSAIAVAEAQRGVKKPFGGG
jgi:malate dehydrogenase (oxaloacetate-decarboxylating)(NADP+)